MPHDRAGMQKAVIKACNSLLFQFPLDPTNVAENTVLRKLLNELVWRYTEAHEFPGKYRGCAWWSVEALELYDTSKANWRKGVAIDHVVGRKELIDDLLNAPSIDRVSAILARGETCVILRKQHDKLPKGQGWERYADLKIVPGPLARRDQRRPGSPISTSGTTDERVATILLPNSVAHPIRNEDTLTPSPV